MGPLYQAGAPVAGSQITLTGVPNSTFFVFMDTVANPDVAIWYGTPPFPGILEVATPPVDLTPLIVAGGIPNQIPATGRVVIPLPTAFGPGPAVYDVQAVATDPNTGQTVVSNGVRRVPFTPVDVYAGGGLPSEQTYIDIEQGDIDSDGDLDVVVVTCSGLIEVYTVAGPAGALGTVPVQVFDLPALSQGQVLATACELVDVDNDGFLDIAFSAQTIGGGILLNAGRTVQGIGPMGPWANFNPIWTPLPIPVAANGSDIEAADYDNNGTPDLLLGCGIGVAEQNRLLTNTTVTPGAPAFVDVTMQTAMNGFLDVTEDVEFFDLEDDGDFDIAIANYASGPNDVQNANRVFVQTGIGVGPAAFPLLTAPIQVGIDPSLDVVVGDLNSDGFGDLYFSNWLAGPATAPDALWAGGSVLGGIVFTNVSAQIPQPMPVNSADAELLDYDLDGDLDIVVGLGGRCIATTDTGLVVYENASVAGGPILLQLPDNPILPTLAGFEVNDIEIGDLSARWPDTDLLIGGAGALPIQFLLRN